MAKTPIPCPADITTPPVKKCWSDGKDLQKGLTAKIFKKFECEGNCSLYVIVNVKELGVCPDDPSKKEFEIIVEIGCIILPAEQREYSEKMSSEEIIKMIIEELEESSEEQHKC